MAFPNAETLAAPETPANGVLASSGAGVPPIGELIAGKYRVEGLIGSGAMAFVVGATHVELDTAVAIKILRPEVLDRRDLIGRFAREARAAAKIKSEHVAQIFDVGKLADGTPFIVMERLDGIDLAQYLETNGPLPPEAAAACCIQVCEALAEAHNLGIIHRDIKPANLFLLALDGPIPTIKVLDFGISKAALGTSAAEHELAKTQSLMGTPLYMSPEQLRETGSVDARSDIWSLGIVLYELLTGRVAFQAETIPRLTITILEDPPPSVRQSRADVPSGIDKVIKRCLEKRPAERYQSVVELAEALAPFAPLASRASVGRIQQIFRRSSTAPPARSSWSTQSEGWVGTGSSVRPPSPARGRWLKGGLLVASAAALLAVGGLAATRFADHPVGAPASAEAAGLSPAGESPKKANDVAAASSAADSRVVGAASTKNNSAAPSNLAASAQRASPVPIARPAALRAGTNVDPAPRPVKGRGARGGSGDSVDLGY